MPHLVAYDIADNQRRYQLARILQDYGQRVQESVFWIDVETLLLDRMWLRIGRVIDEKEDIVWLVPVCRKCSQEVKTRGKEHVPEAPEFYIL